MSEVVVKKLTPELIKLERIKTKAEKKAESVIFFFPAFFKVRAEIKKKDFWFAVSKEWPELIHLDQTIRYDDTIVFKPYSEK